MFDKDKSTLASMVCFQVMKASGDLSTKEINALLFGKSAKNPGAMGPLSEWMPMSIWERVKGLEATGLPDFDKFGDELINDADDWMQWFNHEKPESLKLPGK